MTTVQTVLLVESMPMRGFVLASRLRQQGLRASVLEPGSWSTSDVDAFAVSFDRIGKERLRLLKERFPRSAFVSYSERDEDAGDAMAVGAHAHVRPDADALTRALRALMPKSFDDIMRFGERLQLR